MDGRRIRNNKVAFSNLSGIVWTGPKRERPSLDVALQTKIMETTLIQAIKFVCGATYKTAWRINFVQTFYPSVQDG